MSSALVLFGLLILFLLLSVPVGFALLLSSLGTILLTDISLPFSLLTQVMITANDSFPLMAIPFFILAGVLMGRGGVSERLLNIANSFVGHYRGGFAIAAVLTAMFFSAISGSGPATVAAIGTIMIPEMVKRGYNKLFATALIAAAGTIGIVIPPSIPLVIYGVSSGTSIGNLFKAGIIPGILMGFALMLWAYLHARKENYKPDPKATWKERFEAINKGKGAILMPVVILGGIYGGIFTPTEAAVVAVVYGLVLSFLVYRELNWKQTIAIFYDSAISTGSIMLIVAAAAVFGRILALEQIPNTVAASIMQITDNPIVFLLLVNLLLLVVGTFMETIAAVIILTPILLPLSAQMGVDPIHFGIIMIVNLSLGFITPPLGLNLFVASSISNIKIEPLSKAIMPGFLALILSLLIITYISWISLVLV
ncbi:C4-dicarboxylate transporter, DctM subunit [Psychrobacillus psychrotolerans]|uniref:C4-dicarboxylate transporter, DctM subunit n=1 Tax=Psychrobacillus psychrotolerans TaxID=126156 RepID=A0A1I6ABH8_9BACI|nr:TRAP transporter large permease [Psychrobacillus psychrotolerans]SFQ66049.1 C4-dicarboxylate transporter, DctM subunit [Psychrobacillus psychrotolerans]